MYLIRDLLSEKRNKRKRKHDTHLAPREQVAASVWQSHKVARRPRGGTCRLWSSERKIVLWCCTLVVNRHLTLTFLSPLSLAPEVASVRVHLACSRRARSKISSRGAAKVGVDSRGGESFEERVEEDGTEGGLGLPSGYIDEGRLPFVETSGLDHVPRRFLFTFLRWSLWRGWLDKGEMMMGELAVWGSAGVKRLADVILWKR